MVKIKNAFGKWDDVTELNYSEYLGESSCKLGEGIIVIKTDDPLAPEILSTTIKGQNATHTFYYFRGMLAKNLGEQTRFRNDCAYTVFQKGEFPITVDEGFSEVPPIFNMSDLDPQIDGLEGSDSKIDFNRLALDYFESFDYAKYNGRIFYFHPDTRRWRPLDDYEDYNILISLKNLKYVKKDKSQIKDSMQVYLDRLEERELNKDLLLFKNDKVYNMFTGETTDFDGSQFILKSLNANWHELDVDIPEKDMFLTKLLNDLVGINEYSSRDPLFKRRYRDLLIYIGYILSNSQKQSGLMLFGKSQNGKSTLANLLSYIKNSSFMIRPESLVTDPFYSSSFYNERILFFDELKPSMMNEKFVSIFNSLLGNDKTSIREMQKSPRVVKTNFSAIITVNEISPIFVTYRALLRRVKIMNSDYKITKELAPGIFFPDELNKQNNIDWLANTALRMFRGNSFRVDNLFLEDTAKWVYELNPLAKKYLNLLKEDGLLDNNLKVKGKIDKFKQTVSQEKNLDVLLKYREKDMSYFDEQLNIVFQFVLDMPDLVCMNGDIKWQK